MALREFLGLVLPEAPPDHSTISRTRRLIDLETHEAVIYDTHDEMNHVFTLPPDPAEPTPEERRRADEANRIKESEVIRKIFSGDKAASHWRDSFSFPEGVFKALAQDGSPRA